MDLLGTLHGLEVALHQPVIRGDAVRLKELLHPRFHEIGRSGREYSRDDVIAGLLGLPQEGEILSQDYHLEPLFEGLALLTYRSAHLTGNGALDRHSYRASLWELTAVGWQLRFHQATPTEVFEVQAGS